MAKSRIRPYFSKIFFFTLGLFVLNGLTVAGAFVSLHGDMKSPLYSYSLREEGEYRDFKVFLPPGSTRVSLNVFCVNDAYWMWTVSRFVRLNNNGQIKFEGYGEHPEYVDSWGYTLSELESDYRFSKNWDGVIKIAEYNFQEPLSVDESGWIYVRVLGGWNVKGISYKISVNPNMYAEWYRNINWFTDVDSSSKVVPGDSPNYDPPVNDPPPVQNDPPQTQPDDPVFGTPDRFNDGYTPPSNPDNTPDPNCKNPFYCPPNTSTPPGDDDHNPLEPGNPSNGDDSEDDKSGVTDPVVPIMCGKNSRREITEEDLDGRTVAIPLPRMTTDGISETLNYYAMIIVGPKMYIAVRDEFYPEIISFIEYQVGDRIRSYKSGPLEMSSYWDCDVFAENLYNIEVPVQVLAQNDVRFVCGYAPEAEVMKGNLYETLRYVDLHFDPSLK